MNYTQNRKIMQVTETTFVVGVDIGSQWHYARAFDWRGIELTRKVFRFSNGLDGYIAFGGVLISPCNFTICNLTNWNLSK